MAGLLISFDNFQFIFIYHLQRQDGRVLVALVESELKKEEKRRGGERGGRKKERKEVTTKGVYQLV